MSITKPEYCQHGQHFVESEKITWIYPESGGRRRICVDCKHTVEAAKKNTKKMLTKEKKSSIKKAAMPASKP